LDFDRQAGRIDLHIHSTASDGTNSPLQLLDMARAEGLRAISITDHDSIEGTKQVDPGRLPEGLLFLTGVEISAAPPPGYPLPGSLHILGYGFDPGDPALNRSLQRLQTARSDRNPQILQRLQRIGIDLRREDIAAAAPGGQLGRPHIARALVQKGHAHSIEDAFDRFLGSGKPAYVDKYRIPAEEAVAALRAAGGVAVLAHPFLIEGLDEAGLLRLAADLKALGLQGIEVYYPGHSSAQVKSGLSMAARFGLLVTGGTDFHGDLTPEIKLGRGAGDLFVPFCVYEALVAALPAR